MIRSSFAVFVVAALLLSASEPSSAQSAASAVRFGVGATGAVTWNEHTGGFTFFSNPDCDCATFTDGKGTGRQLGIAVRYVPFDFLAVGFRVVDDPRPAHFERNMPDAFVVMPGSSEVVNQRTVATSDVDYHLVTAEVSVSGRLPVLSWLGLTIDAGPTMSFVQRGTISQYQEIVEPENARFTNPEGLPTENNGRRLVHARNADIQGMAATRISAKIGAGLDVGPFHGLSVQAGVGYDIGLTSVTTEERWKVHSLIAHVSILKEL